MLVWRMNRPDDIVCQASKGGRFLSRNEANEDATGELSAGRSVKSRVNKLDRLLNRGRSLIHGTVSQRV